MAIISVYLFHLDPSWLPGGFVGVDVFFVISGFLITSIIHRDLEAGSFSLGRFYQRRISRIFPAFFFVALATLVAAAFVYSSQDLGSAGANLTAAALSLSNLKSMLQGNYFQASEDSLPFLHYWSLSLEEQYYLVFPLLLLAVHRFAWRRLAVALWISFAASLLLGIILTRQNPTWAFFLLPARAWELLAGGLLAVHAAERQLIPSRWSGAVSAAGALLLIVSFIIVPQGNSFPGYWALLPVAGTLAVLAAGDRNSNGIEKLLSRRPLVAIGKVSYSLYLWHWPVFALVDYGMFSEPEWLRLLLKVGISITGAVASYHLLENPVRVFLNRPARHRFSYAAVTAVTLISCLIGWQVHRMNYINASEDQIARGGLVFGPESDETIALIGDSNASMYGLLLKDLAEDHGQRFICLSAAASDPLPKVDAAESAQPRLWQDILSVVRRERPSTIFLVCQWEAKLKGSRERLDKAICKLSPFTEKIVIITQPPMLPGMASREEIRDGAKGPFFEDANYKASRMRANDYVVSKKSPKVEVLRSSGYFDDGRGGIKISGSGSKPYFHDARHLSAEGAALLEERISASIEPAH